MADRLKDKVAIVTGAGSIGPGWGNGKACAVLFAREGAKVFAVDKSGEAMQETIDRVARIVRKQNLAGDLDVQALEDALCLVFLETQFHDLARQLDEDRMADVLQKTWRKMSDEGKRLALGIAVDDADRALLKRALGE